MQDLPILTETFILALAEREQVCLWKEREAAVNEWRTVWLRSWMVDREETDELLKHCCLFSRRWLDTGFSAWNEPARDVCQTNTCSTPACENGTMFPNEHASTMRAQPNDRTHLP